MDNTTTNKTIDLTLTYEEVHFINTLIRVSQLNDLLCTDHEDCMAKDAQLIDKFNYIEQSMVREFGEL